MELGKLTQPEASVLGVDVCQRLSKRQHRAVLGMRGGGLRKDIQDERQEARTAGWEAGRPGCLAQAQGHKDVARPSVYITYRGSAYS